MMKVGDRRMGISAALGRTPESWQPLESGSSIRAEL
jgi:hypothetical protein